jgi:Domain of unknown function (DUF1877)
MSSYCDHYACTKDLLDRFLVAAEADDPDEALAELEDELYGKRDVMHNEINFKWEDIHRCLTDDVSDDLDFYSGDYPLRLCIHGGEWRIEDPPGSHTMTLVKADELPALCKALKPIDREWLKQKLLDMQGEVPRYTHLEDEFIDDVWEEFDSLRKFYEKAKKAGLAVICTISH